VPGGDGGDIASDVAGISLRRTAAEIIKPNDRLTSFERLEIYNRQYWFRILSGFAEDFPGLRGVLGERRFDAVAKAYLTDCPSRPFTLRNLGSRLESWLRKHPSWAGTRQQLALDMVRLEWADIEAFDGKAEPALNPEDLAGADAGRLKLRLQPYIQLLDLRYPVDDLLLEVRKEEDGKDIASNAFSEGRKQKRVRAVASLKPSEIFLAVHRLDYSVYFRRLDREEFVILKELGAGRTLGRVLELAMRKTQIPPTERPGEVGRWFQAWAALGWFCRSEKSVTSNPDRSRVTKYE
jgi:Putative DNA-binding domain